MNNINNTILERKKRVASLKRLNVFFKAQFKVDKFLLSLITVHCAKTRGNAVA